MITAQQLADGLGIPISRANTWFVPINDAMYKFNINTPKRIAGFLGQIGEESMLLTHLEENLNYSAPLLTKYFHKYFSAADALEFAHKPMAIANRVYANRYGNGDEASGDGWKYRGGGLPQLTFKANYAACGEALGLDLVENPDLIRTDNSNAALAAAWYWELHGCNELADIGNYVGITHVINGGENGMQQRLDLTQQVLKVLT